MGTERNRINANTFSSAPLHVRIRYKDTIINTEMKIGHFTVTQTKKPHHWQFAIVERIDVLLLWYEVDKQRSFVVEEEDEHDFLFVELFARPRSRRLITAAPLAASSTNPFFVGVYPALIFGDHPLQEAVVLFEQ